MVQIINRLSDEFGTHAILKGGMELRLADCPRHTNDLDYVFIPYTSKTQLKETIFEALQKESGLTISYFVNSRCIRYQIESSAASVQIEVQVALECSSIALSTADLARQTHQQARIIRGMDFRYALAHKLAAWNERELIRDLYDVYYMTVILNVKPHREVLKQRLSKVEPRNSHKKKYCMTIDEFIRKLDRCAQSLTQNAASTEMRDYLSTIELPGLDRKIIGGINRIIEYLSEHE